MNKELNILILEDEERAGEKLIDLIHEAHSQVQINWLRSISEGITYLKANTNLDLIFSDIELLDGNAFKIFDTVKPQCPIIFCTAYNTFYENAFQTNGIAYLLKPYTKSQFKEAWEKYQLLFDKPVTDTLPEEFIIKVKSMIESNRQDYKSTFSVKKPEGVFLLKISNIAYFQAQGDFVLAIDKLNSKHILNYSLAAIEGFIDPKKFFKINRSEIIQIDSIHKYDAYTKNRLAITLSNPKIVLYTSNSRSASFRNWIEKQ